MTRKEKILQFIKNSPQKLWTTTEIADSLDIYRSNVSKELNTLVAEGKLIKTSGRPVRYQLKNTPIQPSVSDINTKFDTPTKTLVSDEVFSNVIGSKFSLKNQVEQAKAAILYPPHGLNVLITGPTGSGKTYFANVMNKFAKQQGVITNDEITVFNCADYAHNPQLLMSHLFGYVRGAFTGADEDHEGLFAQADGGMLFLDEVHRLPPEGQEMLFYFIDHGTYSRLGETGRQHQANVRLICATTEDPKSSLLATFVRRIPIMIQMPPLNERTMNERLRLLKYMLAIEASRVQKNIIVDEDVARSLLGSITFGNVGQLKSNVQLVCAQGFLNSMANPREIHLTFEALPQNIKDGLSHLANNRKQLGELAKILEPTFTITPNSKEANPASTDNYELPYNLYEIINDKAAILSREGLNQDAINNFIMTDINVHLKSFYNNAHFEDDNHDLSELVDQRIVNLTQDIEQLLNDNEYTVTKNFKYAMSLHISSFIKRVQSGNPFRKVTGNLIAMVEDYPEEYQLSKKVKNLLEGQLGFKVPESELYYLAVLLISLKDARINGKVGIVVAAHGDSTATSMVQVVEKLLSADNILSYDMSLEVSPTQARDEIAKKVSQIDSGKGVLLLVDMGSLSTFSKKLTEKTGVAVRTIDMVTTAMVLEAARKSALIDSDLETVYHELSEFSGYVKPFSEQQEITEKKFRKVGVQDLRKKAIIAICSTGEGTARKIKEILDKTLVDNLIDDIEVLPVSAVQVQDTIANLNKEYQLVGATGILNPKIPAPYMPLDKLLRGGAEHFIELVEGYSDNSLTQQVDDETQETITDNTIEQYLSEYFTFINPKKFVRILSDYCDYLDRKLQPPMSSPKRLNLIMHLAGVIERTLTGTPLTTPYDLDETKLRQGKMYKAIQEANQLLDKTLNIELPEQEMYYIVQLLDVQNEK